MNDDPQPIEVGEYKPGKGPHFAQVPMSLLRDTGKDSYAVAVFAAIYGVTFFTREKRARVSDKELGELAGCHRNTVQRARNWLREKGWLAWVAREGEANLYHVNMTPAPEKGGPSQGGPSQVDPPTSQVGPSTSQAGGVHPTGGGHYDEEKEEKLDAILEEKPKEIPREGPELPTVSGDMHELKDAWAWAVENAPKYPNMLVRLKLARGLLLDFKVERLGDALGNSQIAGFKFNPDQLIVGKICAWRPLTKDLVELVRANNFSDVLKKWSNEVQTIEHKLITPNARLRDFNKKHPDGYPVTAILYSRRAVPSDALQPLKLKEELSGSTVE